MSRSVCVVCYLLLLASCPTPASPHDVRRTSLIRAPRDAVWQALVAEVAEKGWGIATIDRSSGLLATQWLRIPETYADCGAAPLADTLATRVRMNALVTSVGEGTNFSVSTTFQQLRTLGGAHAIVDCFSTGQVEAILAEHILARVRTSATPNDATH